jgi:branched-chain amino acid transport system ATP-binding protein
MVEPLLRVEGLCCSFGGLKAVDDVSFDIASGSITALIGPNGAGKTTTFAMIAGFQPPDRGRVRFDGVDVTGTPAHVLARNGIARTFQIVHPFTGLTVRDNIAVGAYLRHKARAEALAVADTIAQQVGLAGLRDQPADSLTVAAGKRLELGRALATAPRLLLLDEVMAGLNPSEIRDVLPLIRAIRDAGTTIVLTEHVMQAVMSLSDHIHVLAEGRMIASGAPADIVGNERVVEAYLGQGAARRYIPAERRS